MTRGACSRTREPLRGESLGATTRWIVLGGLTLVSFSLLLADASVAVVAPAIGRGLDVGLGGLGWVMNAYTLAMAVLLLPAGRLADRHGRRRTLLVGIAAFAAASLAAGIASDATVLIGARAVQGAAAALIAPASLAIISTALPARQRAVALGVWAGVSSVALGVGPLVGALVETTLGWRWIFFLNVPVGVAGALLTWRFLSESRSGSARPVNGRAVLASSAGLLALMLSLTAGSDEGWTSPRPLAFLVVAASSFAMFAWIDGRSPIRLIDARRLGGRPFVGANVVAALSASVMCGLVSFLAIFLQNVFRYSQMGAALGLLPMTATTVLVALVSGRIADAIGPRYVAVAGMSTLGLALEGVATVGSGARIGDLLPWLLLAGAGIGLASTPITALAIEVADEGQAAMASAVLGTSRAVGLSVGIAVMGTIMASFGAGAATSSPAFTAGFPTAMRTYAGLSILAAVIAFVALRRGRPHPLRGWRRAGAAPSRPPSAVAAREAS